MSLHRRSVGAVEWVPACVSQCDQELPAGDSYRITGAGIRERVLLLHADGAKVVDIHVDPPPPLGAVGGGLLAGIGGGAAFLGFLARPTTCFGEQSTCDSKAKGNGGTVGGILLVAGGAATLAGILIVIRSSATDVELSYDGKPRDTRPENPRREPTWRDTSRTDPPPVGFPVVFTRTF